MKIKPLIQLRELITTALKSQTNLSKSFQSFFKESMELFLTIPNRINFLQMKRFGHSSEQRFRMNFRKKCCNWIRFNRSFVAERIPGGIWQWRKAFARPPGVRSLREIPFHRRQLPVATHQSAILASTAKGILQKGVRHRSRRSRINSSNETERRK